MNQEIKNDNGLQTTPLVFCFKKLKVLLKQSQVNLVQGDVDFSSIDIGNESLSKVVRHLLSRSVLSMNL